ncbi:MAG: sulfite exporter TauE/SafE family protein [Waddliaceae bacterium]|jgi:uncharacterized membrane protein YfcA|nr:sulfite exporter TauE/SafE family protein [Waddliaceae bacterium]MBT3579531.1 sulfite exporter TauE/SafE family protein [Waddliaceae bacterium]MBT4444551.1 sulfite exporter TauE/SafE family protein [Waddliaceae bacterium]MBT6928644.1 sulfite exporter TauE/SafE family protein [Waddliaceae bacterium]MBT7265182.1 sulfite exporter TauE/SafE family protein [Waddliaceae bacterium]
MILIIKFIVVVVALTVLASIIFSFRKSEGSLVKVSNKLRLAISGFIACIADTLGIGSFAVFIAFDKHWALIDDKKLPGTLNGFSVMAAMVQSLFFLKFIEIDVMTLVVLVVTSCAGGFFSGLIVTKLNKQTLRLVMVVGFSGIAMLVLSNQLNLLPIGGNAIALHGKMLFIGAIAMFFVGMLPAIGVGIYAPTQVVLFFLGLSPLVAFPIMTTVGVLVQSLTALTFVTKKEIALGETLFLVVPGIIGVLISAPFVAYSNPIALHWMLFAIIIYNVVMTFKTYQQEKTLPTKSS